MTREDIDDIINIICPKNKDFEKPCISPAYLKKELEALALEQESCENEYIKVPKKALKYRTAGMVAYNAEWLKNHFDIERAVICGAQEPCDFARWVAREIFSNDWEYNKDSFAEIACRKLAKLGIVRAKGDEWELVEPESEET